MIHWRKYGWAQRKKDATLDYATGRKFRKKLTRRSVVGVKGWQIWITPRKRKESKGPTAAERRKMFGGK